MTDPLSLVLALIARRQPLSADEVFMKVSEAGRSLSVEVAYVRSGGMVSKHYHVSPSLDITLASFSLSPR